MKKVFCILALIFCVNSFCYSQAVEVAPDTITVSGVVTDEEGLTIPGVIVAIIDSTPELIPMEGESCCDFYRRKMERRRRTRTATNLRGKYSFNVPKNAILEYSFMGLESQRIAVEGQREIDVVLKQDKNFDLSGVVISSGVPRIWAKDGFVCGKCQSVNRWSP